MTAISTMRLGTRGSRLAVAQARIAANALRPVAEAVELVEIATHGDRLSARRPRGGWEASDGQFTAELERALLDGRVDAAIHSLKDLPTQMTDGLVLGAILERGDPRDCLVSRHPGGLDGLPFGARIGTGSPRRAAQLAALRADLLAQPIRGNVETRLRRLAEGEYDAVVLAAAGLERLGMVPEGTHRLPFEQMLPAPGQAALALQVRADDAVLRSRLASLDHRPSRVAVEAERALLRAVGGGCLAPLGALGEVDGDSLRLRAAYEDRSGAFVRVDLAGPADDAPRLVAAAADRIRGVVAGGVA